MLASELVREISMLMTLEGDMEMEMELKTHEGGFMSSPAYHVIVKNVSILGPKIVIIGYPETDWS